MADPKVRKRRLSVAVEASYAAASPTGHTEWPLMGPLGDLTDGKDPLETNRQHGRNGKSPRIAGPDGGQIDGIQLEVCGLAAEVGDGSSPGANDYLDDFLSGIGAQSDFDGEGVASHSGTALSLDSDIYDAGDLVPLKAADGTLRFAPIVTDSGGGAYVLGYDPGITATLAPGCKQYRDDNGTDLTKSFSPVYEQDDTQFLGLGGKLTSVSMEAAPRQQARFTATMAVDSMTVDSSVVLDEATGETTATPDRVAIPYIDGVEVDSAGVTIEFGIDAQERPSTNTETGRSEWLQIVADPTVTITPRFEVDHRNLKRNATVFSLVVQVGRSAFYAPRCQVVQAQPTDRNGGQGQELSIEILDPGEDGIPKWQWVRSA